MAIPTLKVYPEIPTVIGQVATGCKTFYLSQWYMKIFEQNWKGYKTFDHFLHSYPLRYPELSMTDPLKSLNISLQISII